MMTSRRAAPWVLALLLAVSVAYPLLVWLALDRFSPRWVALGLLTLALARAWATREAFWLAGAIGATVLAVAGALTDHSVPLKLYPVLVNAVMLGWFASSLRGAGPSAVERMARLREPTLPAAAVAYTRRVTQVWCLFFLANGAVAAFTALALSDRAWALYNGGIAYALMGGLMAVEWLVRRRVRARIAAAELAGASR